jgi:hypothetical protein
MISDGETTYAYDALNRLLQRGGQSLRYADQSNNAVSVGGELVCAGITAVTRLSGECVEP